jgi:prepilin-type N-terminal cleavage/methylation domain-containing protein
MAQRAILPRDCSGSSGFSLVEVIVVLALLALATALVAPALIVPEEAQDSALSSIVDGVQELAIRRGETLRLQLTTEGSWHVEAGASGSGSVLAEGRLEGALQVPPFTLVASPIGTCGFDVRSSGAAGLPAVDPLTCALRAP